MATVAVIIPSYNHGRFLRACLDSVLAQTFTDWELLLMDDGSTDDSVAIAQEYATRDSRIRVGVNETNLGTYGTEQKCLESTESLYVAVMNSDDFWHPEKLAKQVAALESELSASFSYVLGWKADEEGVVDNIEDVHADWPTTPLQDLLPYLLKENRILASGVLFRRDGLRFDTSCRYSGDHVALLEASLRGLAACVPERLTYWRMHGNNTFTVSEKQMLEEIRIREAVLAEAGAWRRARPGDPQVESGLVANASNLFAVYTLFGYRRRIAKLARYMVGANPNRRAALKRFVSIMLPRKYLRDYFWGYDKVGERFSSDFRGYARQIEALPPIKFHLA